MCRQSHTHQSDRAVARHGRWQVEDADTNNASMTGPPGNSQATGLRSTQQITTDGDIRQRTADAYRLAVGLAVMTDLRFDSGPSRGDAVLTLLTYQVADFDQVDEGRSGRRKGRRVARSAMAPPHRDLVGVPGGSPRQRGRLTPRRLRRGWQQMFLAGSGNDQVWFMDAPARLGCAPR